MCWPVVGAIPGSGEAGADELDRAREHVGPVGLLREPGHADLEVGVVGQRLGGVDRGEQGVVLRRPRHPLRRGLGEEDVAELGLQLPVAARVVGRVLRARVALEEVGPADVLAERLPERLLGGHEQDVPVGAVVHLVAHTLLHPAGAGCPPLVTVGLVAGDLGFGSLVGLVGLTAEPVHGRGRVGLGDLHLAALAGGPGLHDAGEDPHGAR